MISNILRLLIIIICILTFIEQDLWSFHSHHQVPISIKINNVRSKIGSLRIAVFQNSQQYETQKPASTFIASKNNLKNGSISYNIALDDGIYGIAVLDDENDNGKLDYGFLVPIEGFGFSNYYLQGLSQPTFEQFKFQISGDTFFTIAVKIKYM